MYSRYDLNPLTIRVLVIKLPSPVFDYVVNTFPEFLEMETEKTQYINWEPVSIHCLLEESDFDTIDEMCEHYTIIEFDDGQGCDGCLVIE